MVFIFGLQRRPNTHALLAPVAQDLLSAATSQAYMERAFSVCGDLKTEKRNRMTKTTEQRVFFKINCKYYA
jgi:hypothetical protein